VNNMGCPETEFLELMANKHRTLQQSFTKLCLKWVEKVAADNYKFDGRNQKSHQTCKRIMEQWAKHNETDGEFMTPELMQGNPPSTWLPMV